MEHSRLMADWQAGDVRAGDELLKQVHDELERIARLHLSGELNSSLSTGDLINEAVIRISKLNRIEFRNRAHILAMASRVMRQVLVDQARQRNRLKRYHTKVTLQTNAGDWQMPLELMSLDGALTELRDIDPQRADIVEMRFFGGMSLTDISTVLDVSVATVKRRWQASRIWLKDRMGQKNADQ